MRAKTKKWFSPLFVLTLAVAGIFGVSAAVVDKQVNETPVVEEAEAATNTTIRVFVNWSFGDNHQGAINSNWGSGTETSLNECVRYWEITNATASSTTNTFNFYFREGSVYWHPYHEDDRWNRDNSDIASNLKAGYSYKLTVDGFSGDSGWDNIHKWFNYTFSELGCISSTTTTYFDPGTSYGSYSTPYCYYTDVDGIAPVAWHGTAMTKVDNNKSIYGGYRWKATVTSNASLVIFNNNSSAQTADLSLDGSKTYLLGTGWVNNLTLTTTTSTTTTYHIYSGVDFTLPSLPSAPTGYTAEWNTASDGSGTKYSGTVNVNSNLNLYAYNRPSTYTITWKNGNGETIETDNNVPYGSTPTYDGATPTKTSTAQYDYTWNGSWTPAISSVTGNQTYTATFDSTVRKYTVTWKNGSTTLETDTNVPYGTTPTYDGATPTKASTDQYSYTFSGWSPAVGPISGDTIYSAQFNQTARSYNLTYKYVDTEGNEIDSATVASTAYNTAKTLPTPSVDGYKYKTWHDGDGTSGTERAIGYAFNMPAANTTFTAEFEHVGGYLLGLDGDWSTLTEAKHMSEYGEENYVYKNVTLAKDDIFIVYQVPTSGNNTWHGYRSVNGGDAVDDFENANDGYDHIKCKTAGTYDIVLNTNTGKVFLYRKGTGAIDQGYYMIGTGSFASDTTPTWAFANAIKMGAGTHGNTAELESAGGTPISAGSIFKVAYHNNTSSNTWYNMTLGGSYDFASINDGKVTITKRGNYNFYFKIENSTNYIYIVDVGAITEFGYLYFSSDATPENIHFTSKLANGDVVVDNQLLSTISGLETTSKVGSFDGKTYLYKFPIYNLRGNQGGALVTQVVYNDGTETTVTGIPTSATDTPHYYARNGAASLADGKAAQAVFDIDAVLYNKNTSSYVSVCTISQSTAQTLKAEYDAATSAGSSLHSSATINTYATIITDPTKANVSVALIYTHIAAIAETGSPANAGSIRSFSPYSLIGEEGSFDSSVILIIIASSVALLSVTALSILLVKKKKTLNK